MPVKGQILVDPTTGDTCEFLETADGRRKGNGSGLMQELVSLRYLESKAFLSGPPVWVQKLMMRFLAPLGRLLGYRAVYSKYSGIEK